jgi:hypothetical protein
MWKIFDNFYMQLNNKRLMFLNKIIGNLNKILGVKIESFTTHLDPL